MRGTLNNSIIIFLTENSSKRTWVINSWHS
jgi:hypothetical protein